MDFFGHDVCGNGNCTAMSKHAPMEHWPSVVTAQDIASFVGFLNFYPICFPSFKQRIMPLHDLTKLEMVMVITDLLTPAHEAAKC